MRNDLINLGISLATFFAGLTVGIMVQSGNRTPLVIDKGAVEEAKENSNENVRACYDFMFKNHEAQRATLDRMAAERKTELSELTASINALNRCSSTSH